MLYASHGKQILNKDFLVSIKATPKQIGPGSVRFQERVH